MSEWVPLVCFYAAQVTAWACAESGLLPARHCWIVLALRAWILFLFWFTCSKAVTYIQDFGSRKKRTQRDSPSHKRRPDVRVRRRRSHRRHTAEGDLVTGPGIRQPIGTQRAEELDMDHVYLSFGAFMWGQVFFILPLYANFLLGGSYTLGLLRYGLSFLLQRAGLWRRAREDPRTTCASLCLNTSLAVYLRGITEPTDGRPPTAHFEYPHAPHFCSDGTAVYKNLSVAVDLEHKVMVRAQWGDDIVPPNTAMILLNMTLVFMVHPQLHAYTNWACNPECPNTFFRRCSIATITYNHAGCQGFARALHVMGALGVFKKTDPACVHHMISSSMRQNIPPHAQIIQLMPHSSFINFVVKTRAVFMRLFQKHRAEFTGIDGEALFLSSVFHSLDHVGYVTSQNVLDLMVEDQEFDEDARVIRLVLMGLPDALWLSSCFYRFDAKASSCPLWSKTYEAAARIDKTLAAEIECCVMR